MVLIAAVGFKSIVTATAMVQTMLAGIGYLAVEGLRLSRSNPKRRTLKHWVLEKFQEVGLSGTRISGPSRKKSEDERTNLLYLQTLDSKPFRLEVPCSGVQSSGLGV